MSIWKRYKAYNLRREQRSLEHWPQQRAKGKVRYVLYRAFSFTVALTAYFDVTDQLRGRSNNTSSFWIYMGFYAVGGLFVGYMAWIEMENKYKKALLDGRLQRPFDDRLIPH